MRTIKIDRNVPIPAGKCRIVEPLPAIVRHVGERIGRDVILSFRISRGFVEYKVRTI